MTRLTATGQPWPIILPPSPLERAKAKAEWHKARAATEGEREEDERHD